DVRENPDPRTFYGISKLRGEEHMKRLADKESGNKNFYIIRCGNVYGYNSSMRFDAVINRFIFDANFSGRIFIDGDGRQYRAFIHVEKAADCLGNLLEKNIKPGIYNLVDRNLTVLEIVNELQQLYPEWETQYINQHLKLRAIEVQPDPNINGLMKKSGQEFYDELKEFKQKFTF
ncbi:MAG: SDR family oxidoreductase, partial [Flavobacteriales bacterium]